MLRKIHGTGIRVTTTCIAGRYQHKVFDIRVRRDRSNEIPQDIVEAQQKVNQLMWEHMPNHSGPVTSYLTYIPPKRG